MPALRVASAEPESPPLPLSGVLMLSIGGRALQCPTDPRAHRSFFPGSSLTDLKSGIHRTAEGQKVVARQEGTRGVPPECASLGVCIALGQRHPSRSMLISVWKSASAAVPLGLPHFCFPAAYGEVEVAVLTLWMLGVPGYSAEEQVSLPG